MRSAGFGGSTSIRGDVDVRETFEIVLRLLSHQQNKRINTRRHLRSRSSRIMKIVKELPFNVSIGIRLEENEKSDVVSQCLDQSFFSPFALRINSSLKKSERG